MNAGCLELVLQLFLVKENLWFPKLPGMLALGSPTQSCILARAIRKKKKNNTKSDRDIN